MTLDLASLKEWYNNDFDDCVYGSSYYFKLFAAYLNTYFIDAENYIPDRLKLSNQQIISLYKETIWNYIIYQELNNNFENKALEKFLKILPKNKLISDFIGYVNGIDSLVNTRNVLTLFLNGGKIENIPLEFYNNLKHP